MAKYDKIGIQYNQTRKADPYLVSRLFHHLNPQPKGQYLDIGCGTGNYTLVLHQKGVSLTGIDPSEEMLKKARSKDSDITWIQGEAENIPLEDSSMNGIMASLTLHHWTDLEKAFKELNRVLIPGGNWVIFTATSQQMKGYWLNEYFPKMLQDSIDQMPDFEWIQACMKKAELEITDTEKYFIKPDLKDLFLYAGKMHPEYYLNPVIRNGISSFSALANQKEVSEGLDRLKNDIETGAIAKVIGRYENQKGDYLFIIGKKPKIE